MDPTGIRSSSSISSGNIRVTAVEDASQAGAGGITFLDYSRVHIVPPGQGRGGTVVPVEDVAMSDVTRNLGGNSAARVREVAQQAAEVCRTARQICVQNGNAGAERAARDALAIMDKIAATTFQKS